MSAPVVGPCTPWITPEEILGCEQCGENDALSKASDTDIDTAIAIASEVLYAKSGREFSGFCEQTVRPCCRSQFGGRWYGAWGWNEWQVGAATVALVEGRWYNFGGCSTPCVMFECGKRIPRVDLGDTGGPVDSIVEVKIDGEVLAPSAYRLDDFRYLTRIDGEMWPSTQDLLSDDTQVGTWSVKIQHGWPVPPLGKAAASELACELILDAVGDDACALPKRATQATRQGITYTLSDVLALIEKGSLGLYLCELFISTYNPEGLTRRPRVVNIDRLPATRFS